MNYRLEKNFALNKTHYFFSILGPRFEVMNELGIGFLESVYKNALFFALREKGLLVETEKWFEVYFKGQKIGLYKADIVGLPIPEDV